MSFSANWLTMREPYDRAARDQTLAGNLCAYLANKPAGPIVDLGGGTGSTARTLAADFGVERPWVVLDHDPDLLAYGRERHATHQTKIDFRHADLTSNLAALIPPEAVAVTTSALLDLVSEAWLSQLVGVLQRRNLPFYAALTYDGRMRWRPGDIFDQRIKQIFDNHQHTDKGFGPALGPDAPSTLATILSDGTGTLQSARSDWTFEQSDRAIQVELLQGYANAALELAPAERKEIADWHRQRTTRLDNGQSRHIVGHVDQLWIPAA